MGCLSVPRLYALISWHRFYSDVWMRQQEEEELWGSIEDLGPTVKAQLLAEMVRASRACSCIQRTAMIQGQEAGRTPVNGSHFKAIFGRRKDDRCSLIRAAGWCNSGTLPAFCQRCCRCRVCCGAGWSVPAGAAAVCIAQPLGTAGTGRWAIQSRLDAAAPESSP